MAKHIYFVKLAHVSPGQIEF